MEEGSANFEYLRPHKEMLSRIGSLAEASLYSDPANTAGKARLFAEKSVEIIYEMFRLPDAVGATFFDRLNEDVFKGIVPKTILDKLHFIRKKGNLGVHDLDATTPIAIELLREVYDLGRWMYILFWNGKGEDVPTFRLPPNPVKLKAEDKRTEKQLRDRIASQEAELQILLEKLEEARAQFAAQPPISIDEMQVMAGEGQRASDVLKFSEEETRKRLIDLLIAEAGWNLNDSEEVRQEVSLPNGEIADYVLYLNGLPAGVIEAKRTSSSADRGRTQAKLYADELEKAHGQRPVIFYSNGYETFLWNDAMNETPRRVFGFYSPDSLSYLMFQREHRVDITDIQPDPKIAGRIYQIESIKRVAENFQRGKRKALLVQATGTGKTRVAVSIAELMTRAKWAKRILFLCDRRELRKQADDVFKEFLHGEPRTFVTSRTSKDRSKRVYLATYPAMMQSFESFDVGFFDLIIADESHRSIYNRYRDIFLYFDALQIGLTATPVGYINRNTFELFECENNDATANYSYQEAIKSTPPYLVPFEVSDDTTDFLRRGIKYKQLNQDQRQQLEESEEDAETFDYEPEQLNKLVFNRPTNEFIIRNLMERGIRDGSGQQVGKSIIFARNHNHAKFLEKVFDELYPQYGGGFCRVIDSHDERAEDLITEFKKPDSKLTIAISVDMLDTGIDVPEIVNLVFAKPVKSYVKFWQMIGRGTRLREHLFGLGKHKTKFLIFDHCGNFEFFDENYKAPEVTLQKSLLQRLFEARIELAKTSIDVQSTETLDNTIDLIKQDIASLPESSISVKEKWREVLEVQRMGVIESFAPQTVEILRREIAPLMQWRSIAGLERQYEFDLLLTRLQEARLRASAEFGDHRDKVRAMLSRLPVTINEVRERLDLINQAKNLQYWEGVRPNDIESIRVELRGLMRLLAPLPMFGPPIRETDIDEDESKFERRKIVPKLEGLDLVAYRQRVQAVLESLVDESSALQKIKQGERLEAGDFDELCKLVLAQDPELDLHDLQTHFPEMADRLDIAIRSIIGMHAEAVNMRFESFVQQNNLNSRQIRFLTLLRNHLTRYGTIELDRLYEAPFTDIDSNGIDGVFTEDAQVSAIFEILELKNSVN